MDTYRITQRIFDILCRYNPDVARLTQYNPEIKGEILDRLDADIRAILYAIPSDVGDALIEKIEDAVEAGTLGTSAPLIEAIGAILERILLQPLEKKYYETISKFHPLASIGLQAYQLLTEIPALDTVLSLIPEKTIYAIGVFVYDIVNIIRKARRYGKDYVEELYGKRGVEGGEGYPHPLRPAVSVYT
ncbi:MAG: hypothetical protein QXY45_03930 [Candidatus Aenigmatarchaeota archaeon]